MEFKIELNIELQIELKNATAKFWTFSAGML